MSLCQDGMILNISRALNSAQMIVGICKIAELEHLAITVFSFASLALTQLFSFSCPKICNRQLESVGTFADLVSTLTTRLSPTHAMQATALHLATDVGVLLHSEGFGSI